MAHASWTKPSVASILTSRLPGQHRAVQLRDPLDASQVTIAQRLDAQGFATGAAIANSVIYGAESAFDRGFDLFAGLHGDDDTRSKLVGADVVVDQALAFLRARRGLPTFLYVHTMDPHVPYAPPAPFDRMFEPHATRGAPGARPAHRLQGAARPRAHDRAVRRRHRLRRPRVRPLRARAQGDAASTTTRSSCSWPTTARSSWTTARWLHGRSLFDELIRIPLVVKFPGKRGAGTRVARQVQGIDVAPTVLEAMELALAPDLAGRPLQRALERDEAPRPALAEISHRGFVAHGVRTEDEKYVRRFSPDDDELLFDLRSDPREQESLAAPSPERVRLRKAQVEAGMAQNPFRYVLQARGTAAWRCGSRRAAGSRASSSPASGRRSARSWAATGARSTCCSQPREGAPREIAFTVRPIGAPVLLSGTRDGRPLRPPDVAIGEGGQHPEALPYRLPDIESETERDRGPAAVRGARLGPLPVRLWLDAAAGPVAGRARRRRRASGCARSATWARAERGAAPRPRPRRHARRLLARHRGLRQRDAAAAAPGHRGDPARAHPRLRRRGRPACSSSARSRRRGWRCRSTTRSPSTSSATASACSTTTRLYPGVAEALAALGKPARRWPCLTNKPGDMSRTILEGLGVAASLRADRRPGRRARAQARPERACWRCWPSLGSAAPDAWMVGDSATDVETGRAASVRVAGVSWGFHPAAMRAAAPTASSTPRPSSSASAAAEAGGGRRYARLASFLRGNAHGAQPDHLGRPPFHAGRPSAGRRSGGRGALAGGPRGRARRPRRGARARGSRAARGREGRVGSRGCATAARRGRCSWPWPPPAAATSCCSASPSSTTCCVRPVTPARLKLKLERAVEAVHSRRVIRQLESALSREHDELNELNEIGKQLSAERDIDKLLELILQKSREITGADAGSLYLVERAKDGEQRPRRSACASSSRRTTPWWSPSRSPRCRSTRPRSPATWR